MRTVRAQRGGPRRASDSGVSAADNITNDDTPSFSGTATDDGSTRIVADGILVASAPRSPEAGM